MAPLYKYFTSDAYAQALIQKGEIFLRPLSYFRAFEDELVRGDPDDGKLHYEPEGGLKLTKANGEVVELPPGWRFRSSVEANDIYVYCLSQELSGDLASKFDSPFCVEIKDPVRLLGRIISHIRLRSRLDRNHIYSDTVAYRPLATPPGADWALPERVAFMKPEGWAWQNEHRIVIGKKGAFKVENVELALEMPVGGISEQGVETDPLIVRVGDLSKIAELHRF